MVKMGGFTPARTAWSIMTAPVSWPLVPMAAFSPKRRKISPISSWESWIFSRSAIKVLSMAFIFIGALPLRRPPTLNNTLLLQQIQNPAGCLCQVLLPRLQDQCGLFGGLVGGRDAREFGDFARLGLLVEALGVAFFADLHGGVAKDLEELAFGDPFD